MAWRLQWREDIRATPRRARSRRAIVRSKLGSHKEKRMSLTRWNPRRDTELASLLDGFFAPVPLRSASLTPAVDVEETPEGYVFRADLPGIEPKDTKITVHGDTLTLRGERKHETEKKEGSLHRIERSYGLFERSFTLGMPVRADQVKATYRNGVLEIRVPKAEEARLR